MKMVTRVEYSSFFAPPPVTEVDFFITLTPVFNGTCFLPQTAGQIKLERSFLASLLSKAGLIGAPRSVTSASLLSLAVNVRL
jgi:hypothetical protein